MDDHPTPSCAALCRATLHFNLKPANNLGKLYSARTTDLKLFLILHPFRHVLPPLWHRTGMLRVGVRQPFALE